MCHTDVIKGLIAREKLKDGGTGRSKVTAMAALGDNNIKLLCKTLT